MATRCLILAILSIVLSAALATRTASAQTANGPRVELGGTFSAILPVVAADGPLDRWSAGPLVGWSAGPLVRRTAGPLVRWSAVRCPGGPVAVSFARRGRTS